MYAESYLSYFFELKSIEVPPALSPLSLAPSWLPSTSACLIHNASLN